MNWETKHNSQRGHFAYELYEQMAKNKDIWLITADLGYKMFDRIFEDFPDRVVNCGASEQAGMGIAIGLALEGKIPVFYSITNFALYRPFEWIRNYVDYEKIKVLIVGGGRDDDYKCDGFTHCCCDAKKVLKLFKNIESYFPDDKEQIKGLLKDMIESSRPSFLSLCR